MFILQAKISRQYGILPREIIETQAEIFRFFFFRLKWVNSFRILGKMSSEVSLHVDMAVSFYLQSL